MATTVHIATKSVPAVDTIYICQSAAHAGLEATCRACGDQFPDALTPDQAAKQLEELVADTVDDIRRFGLEDLSVTPDDEMMSDSLVHVDTEHREVSGWVGIHDPETGEQLVEIATDPVAY